MIVVMTFVNGILFNNSSILRDIISFVIMRWSIRNEAESVVVVN